jgi:hypothetical protein
MSKLRIRRGASGDRAPRARVADDVVGTVPILAPGVRALGEPRQIEVIEYLQEENRMLREQLGGRRLRFTDVQRRRLAVKGNAIGRRALEQFAGLTPMEYERAQLRTSAVA